jgi:hypothetical protein
MIRRVLVVVLVVALSVAAVTAGLGGVAAAGSTVSAEDPDISARAISVADSGAVAYRIDVRGLERTDDFSLVVGANAKVTRVSGLERRSGGDGTRLVASDGRTSASVVVAVDGRSTAGPRYFGADDWALTRVPYVMARWSLVGSDESRHVRPLGDAYGALSDGESATFGDRYALVGSQTADQYRIGDQRVALVRPTGTQVAAGTERVVASLRAANDQLRVGDRDGSVTLFALPDPARRGGESFPARDESWVRADSPVNSANNVWIHEYVHTRQDFRLDTDMAWFREASAEYYAARLTHEQGRISEREMVAHLDGEGVEAPLTDPDAWASDRTPYTKGARVLALLDRHIRQSTDGERTLQDVFRKMNAHDGPVTYADFKDIVAVTAGHSMDGWLDRYVAGEHAIASAYEPRPVRSGVFGLLTAIGNGDTSIIATVVVSLVSSAAISLPALAALTRLRRRFAVTDGLARTPTDPGT